MSCPICTETFNQLTRRETECLYCQSKYCTKCIKKYLLSNNKDPSCMYCFKNWNKEFVEMHMSKYFLKTDYKKHRENILFEREQSLIPKTLQLLDLNSEQTNECHRLLSNYLQEKDFIIKQLSILNQQIYNVRHQIYMLENNLTLTLDNLDHIEKKHFIKKCFNNNCRGYFNHKGICTLCNTIICMTCYEIKEINHKCIDSNIETIELIKKETKPCPNCNISIYKIEGCNQMWCTQCKTAFHWKTGMILHHEIHNPHYYEYIFDNPIINLNIIECRDNELPNIYQINQLQIDFQKKRTILNIHRMIQHIINEELPKFMIENENIFDYNLRDRILYLRNKISIDKYKQLLILKENQVDKKKAFALLYQMLISTMSILFNELLSNSDVLSFMEKYNNLLIYTNKQISQLCKRFNISHFYLNDTLNIIKL